jgi:hypothetical protein
MHNAAIAPAPSPNWTAPARAAMLSRPSSVRASPSKLPD